MPVILSSGCTYEELGHTSEIGVQLKAATAADLFSCAARTMFHLIYGEAAAAQESSDSQQITLSSHDTASLLVDWLSELLYLYETTGHVFHHYDIIKWEPTTLKAAVRGHRPEQPAAMHIKAVTYHQLKVIETAGVWQARVFFDI